MAPGGRAVTAPLTPSGGRAAADLALPDAAGRGALELSGWLEVDVPANAFAGRYTATVGVALPEAN
jgi:hypothetical protein